MEAKKRAWQTPELTVLVRNRPEEAVLAACKFTGTSTLPIESHNGCKQGRNKPQCTTACTASASS